MELPDSRFRNQVVDVLRDLVRIDTTNPPGNETACGRYLARLLADAGIATRIVESKPGRGNLIARIPGSGEGKPLMFMGHLDVVSADPSEWQYPPFAAEVHDGFVWGRGTTDMKNMIAACAVTMLALASLGQPLKRDLLFVATADEEHGGRHGMGWLTREMPELFQVACAINEGGGKAIKVGDRLYYTCQSAEKGICRTVWRAQAKGGHGAYPRQDTSTMKLSQALCELGDGHLRPHATDTMRTALRAIAGSHSEEAARRVDGLLESGQVEEAMVEAGFGADDVVRHRALFYDTASITSLRAGDPASINVIPAVATAYVDCRILPGQTREGFLRLLRERAGGQVEIGLYAEQYSPGLESSTEAPIFRVISQVIADHVEGAVVVPWQCAGSTDAKHLIRLGVPVYGFVPTNPLPDGMEGAGAHANNERVWIENLHFSLQVLYEIAHRFCTQPQQ
ncbi:MAG TPA: M20/M25/M40 family metallo-hydrolase [Anaerolineae bacterium]|nr:M20/M25/M40 family metallo-hydrolase [Anaerolineae bacterium]